MLLRPCAFSKALARQKQFHIQTRSVSKFDIYGNSPVPANKKRFIPTSGTYPKGFLVGSTNVGIKPASKSQPDLILIASETYCHGAAVFTRNEFPAASITVSRDFLKRREGRGLRGIIANSWCANTLTGDVGIADATRMSKEAEKCLAGEAVDEESPSVMVMHTGTGGVRLPIENIVHGISKLHEGMGNSHDHWLEAARGLCTTDTFPKIISRTFTLPSSPDITYSIAGITKGAGMIHPNMATTLGIICTDAPISPVTLQKLLRAATNRSYNCISVDGDTSTNDMVAILANGAAGGKPISFHYSGRQKPIDYVSFRQILTEFMSDMAKLVVRDGEGATKFITIRVRGAPTYEASKHIASAISRSVLFKTAIYGKDPNWGGVLVALGQSLIDTRWDGMGMIALEKTSVSFIPGDGGQALKFLDKGKQGEVDPARAAEVMEQEDIEILVDLRDGEIVEGQELKEAVCWTCDLTHEFVDINGGFDTRT
ncbi:probable Arginine biosynthesis bifunctional protein ArgJ 2, mitochondrial [Phialocephala subalpina]|uniref:Arginine biosynthesis bifunctional protein ArgJ, mitochondrial n=1 Tax=Phialocephala subalpina TaxID=576137 RepID=A0A1L7XD87_9HELO|nr:probable Arginine biosynthesis bifunctional protein ArgJ 2, mitochondrial [Phialocephala subalpina]